jgi:hypothetical protein
MIPSSTAVCQRHSTMKRQGVLDLLNRLWLCAWREENGRHG